LDIYFGIPAKLSPTDEPQMMGALEFLNALAGAQSIPGLLHQHRKGHATVGASHLHMLAQLS
jgi:hypothetical protein